jgi:hypothetical protein
MEKNNHSKIYHYLSLILILVLGLFLFYLYLGYPDKQMMTIIGISILYVVWGAIHHYLQGDLHIKIVVEYILIAAVAILIFHGALIK